MKINWRRLSIIAGIIIVTALAVGSLTLIGLKNIILDQEEQIKLLENQNTNLSQLYSKKLAEKKTAQEQQQKATTNKRTDSQNTATTNESSSGESEDSGEQETPQSQSQILFFYNPSCGACIAQQPIVAELQNEGIPFVLCNVIENPDYISQYHITVTPTFILNGNRQESFLTKAALQNFWNTYK